MFLFIKLRFFVSTSCYPFIARCGAPKTTTDFILSRWCHQSSEPKTRLIKYTLPDSHTRNLQRDNNYVTFNYGPHRFDSICPPLWCELTCKLISKRVKRQTETTPEKRTNQNRVPEWESYFRLARALHCDPRGILKALQGTRANFVERALVAPKNWRFNNRPHLGERCHRRFGLEKPLNPIQLAPTMPLVYYNPFVHLSYRVVRSKWASRLDLIILWYVGMNDVLALS